MIKNFEFWKASEIVQDLFMELKFLDEVMNGRNNVVRILARVIALA
jgi:hypothetical protein